MAVNTTLLGFLRGQSFGPELSFGSLRTPHPPPPTATIELPNRLLLEDPVIKRIECDQTNIPADLRIGHSLPLSRKTPRFHHGNLQPLPRLTINQLDACNDDQISRLADHLVQSGSKVHLSIRSTGFHNSVNTNQLAVLCFFLRDDGINGPNARRFTRFVCLKPLQVIPDLLRFAPGIFTPRNIGMIIRQLMEDCLDPPRTPLVGDLPLRVDPVREIALPGPVEDLIDAIRRAPAPSHRHRLEQRQALSDLGCLLIASFLETRVSGAGYSQRFNVADQAILATVLLEPNIHALLPRLQGYNDDVQLKQSIVAKSDILVMVSIIFESDRLRRHPEPFGWFLGILFGGMNEFARHVMDAKKKHDEHLSTILAFGFAAAGFIPVVGQFAGLVGLLTDMVLRHHQGKHSSDLGPTIARIEGLVMERLSTSLRDFEGRIALIEAKTNTEKMGRHNHD